MISSFSFLYEEKRRKNGERQKKKENEISETKYASENFHLGNKGLTW